MIEHVLDRLKLMSRDLKITYLFIQLINQKLTVIAKSSSGTLFLNKLKKKTNKKFNTNLLTKIKRIVRKN